MLDREEEKKKKKKKKGSLRERMKNNIIPWPK